MARWRIGATGLDREIARAIARRATPALGRPSRILTWCADEHLVLPIAAGFWLLSRAGSAGQRREADHLMTSVGVAAVLTASRETSDCAGAPGPPGDPWPKAWHSSLRQTLRRLSFGARDACRSHRVGDLRRGSPSCYRADPWSADAGARNPKVQSERERERIKRDQRYPRDEPIDARRCLPLLDDAVTGARCDEKPDD